MAHQGVNGMCCENWVRRWCSEGRMDEAECARRCACPPHDDGGADAPADSTGEAPAPLPEPAPLPTREPIPTGAPSDAIVYYIGSPANGDGGLSSTGDGGGFGDSTGDVAPPASDAGAGDGGGGGGGGGGLARMLEPLQGLSWLLSPAGAAGWWWIAVLYLLWLRRR